MHLLNVKAPGDMEIVLDCQGKERFVALSWLDGFDELVIYEGVQEGFGDSDGWKSFLQRDYIAKALKGYSVMGDNKKDAEHALILDKVTRKLWVCDIDPLVMERVLKTLQLMHGIVRKNIGLFDEPLMTEEQLDEIIESSRLPGARPPPDSFKKKGLVKNEGAGNGKQNSKN